MNKHVVQTAVSSESGGGEGRIRDEEYHGENASATGCTDNRAGEQELGSVHEDLAGEEKSRSPSPTGRTSIAGQW